MGVLGDVISFGLNGPSVDESSKQLLGDVITEGLDGHSLGTSSVVIIYIGYIYIFISTYVGMWVRY